MSNTVAAAPSARHISAIVSMVMPRSISQPKSAGDRSNTEETLIANPPRARRSGRGHAFLLGPLSAAVWQAGRDPRAVFPGRAGPLAGVPRSGQDSSDTPR